MALTACGSGEPGEHENLRCAHGPQLAYDAADMLAASSPACTRDEECTLLDTAVDCTALRIGSCGTVVHRDVADDWDARAVCREIEALSAEPSYACDISPSCAAVQPACVSGRCASRR
jgi:hypothetical protein